MVGLTRQTHSSCKELMTIIISTLEEVELVGNPSEKFLKCQSETAECDSK